MPIVWQSIYPVTYIGPKIGITNDRLHVMTWSSHASFSRTPKKRLKEYMCCILVDILSERSWHKWYFVTFGTRQR